MISAISVKDRLKKQAKEAGRTMRHFFIGEPIDETIKQSKKLLMPVVKAIEQDMEFNYCWDKNRKEWI